jgi:uncharacterized protein YgiM (DUF1202 family)
MIIPFLILFLMAIFFDLGIYENSSKLNLRVRSKPSTQSEIVAVLKPDDTAIVLKTNEDWLKVYVNSNVGYIYSKLLSEKKFSLGNFELRYKYLLLLALYFVIGILTILEIVYYKLLKRRSTNNQKTTSFNTFSSKKDKTPQKRSKGPVSLRKKIGMIMSLIGFISSLIGIYQFTKPDKPTYEITPNADLIDFFKAESEKDRTVNEKYRKKAEEELKRQKEILEQQRKKAELERDKVREKQEKVIKEANKIMDERHTRKPEEWEKYPDFNLLDGSFIGILYDTPNNYQVSLENIKLSNGNVDSIMKLRPIDCTMNLKLGNATTHVNVSGFYFKVVKLSSGCPKVNAVKLEPLSYDDLIWELFLKNGHQVSTKLRRKINFE